MVRAVLRDRKTQTRRVFKITRPMGDQYTITSPDEAIVRFEDGTFHYRSKAGLSGPYQCPYGQSGGLLWVREAWRVNRGHDGKPGAPEFPRPDGEGITVLYEAGGSRSVGPPGRHEPVYPDNEPMPAWAGRYRHARFMPRWASRLTLRITDIRAQRLHELSEEDAKAEGILPHNRGGWHWLEHNPRDLGDAHPFGIDTPQHAYRHLWEEINGTESWDENPFVWALTFEKLGTAS